MSKINTSQTKDSNVIPAAESSEDNSTANSISPPEYFNAPIQLKDGQETDKKESAEDLHKKFNGDIYQLAKYYYKHFIHKKGKAITNEDEDAVIEMIDYLSWNKANFTGALIDWIPNDGKLESLSYKLLSAFHKGMAFSFSSENRERRGRINLAIQNKAIGGVIDTIDRIEDSIDREELDKAKENLEKQDTVLTADVGRGKTNNADDVKYVKDQLFKMQIITDQEKNSNDEDVLHNIILRYQRRIEAASKDGVVSKEGTSIQYLMAEIRGVAQSDEDRLRTIKEDEEIAKEIELGEEEVTEKRVKELISHAKGNMENLAKTTVAYMRANSKMVEKIVETVDKDHQKSLVTFMCKFASEPALMSLDNALLEKMHAILDKGITSEEQYTLMAKITKVRMDPISRWLRKEHDDSDTAKKNSSIAKLVLEAEELGLVYFNPEGAGNFDSGFGGCKDTFLKFKNLETIGNGANNSDTFDPNEEEAPILETTLNVIRNNVRDWIRKGKKSKPNLITLGSFMVWNTTSGDRTAGQLRSTNHGKSGKAIDINVYTSDHNKIDFTKDDAEEKVYQIIRDLPSGTYEIGLPFQGKFFPSSAAGGAYHRSKHTDDSWVYHQLKSQRLKDAFNDLLDAGALLKVITDYDNHLHLAHGSGNNYMDKDNKDDNL